MTDHFLTQPIRLDRWLAHYTEHGNTVTAEQLAWLYEPDRCETCHRPLPHTPPEARACATGMFDPCPCGGLFGYHRDGCATQAGPCDRCGDVNAVGFADDVCTECPHAPLCRDCLQLHRTEAVDDGTAPAPG